MGFITSRLVALGLSNRQEEDTRYRKQLRCGSAKATSSNQVFWSWLPDITILFGGSKVIP